MKRKPLTISSGNRRDAIALILPALLATLAVHVIPIGWGILMSFQGIDRYTLGNLGSVPWVGLDNFKEIFTSDSDIGSRFGRSIVNVLVYGLETIPLTLIIALAVALLLNQRFRGRLLVRALVLLPYLTPDSVMYNVWRFIFQSRIGIVNYILVSTGLIQEPLVWLVGDRALAAVIAASVWKGWSLACLMFLAGLQSIPTELYEAAGMDGAGPFRRLLTITIPGLWPIIRTMAILSFIWNFHAFNQFYVLLGGDASSAAAVPNLVIMREAFTNLYYSLGSAMSTLLLSVIVLTVGLVIARRGRGAEE